MGWEAVFYTFGVLGFGWVAVFLCSFFFFFPLFFLFSWFGVLGFGWVARYVCVCVSVYKRDTNEWCV